MAKVLTLREAAKLVGVQQMTIRKWILEEKISGAKKMTINGGQNKWCLPPEAIEKAKELAKNSPNSGHSYGPRFHKKLSYLPKIEKEVDVSFASIESFIPERGKYPYKNLALAVQRAIERKPWEDIEEETGVPQKAIIELIDEYKFAGKKDKKYSKSLMAYLNDDRPYRKDKRNMLEK